MNVQRGIFHVNRRNRNVFPKGRCASSLFPDVELLRRRRFGRRGFRSGELSVGGIVGFFRRGPSFF
jgi:hypothetical protein